MAMFASLRREERIGLGVAAALHALIAAALVAQPDTRAAAPVPERMTVSLVGETGLDASAPEPVAESRAAIAPVLADTPAPPPEPVVDAAPRPRPEPAPPRPAQAQRPAPPQPRAQAARAAAPSPSRATPARPAPAAGGSRVGDNFLAGLGDSTRTSETRAPASAIGASERASLVQAIARELKPHWQPPRGADEDQLVTVLRFRLKRDGSLDGRPTVLRQTGVTDTNRAQAARHAEQAVRAVQLAAPFDLPDRYYDAWKLVSPFRFDWKLAQ